MAFDPKRIGRGFDLVAPIYDWVLWLFFGRSIDRFQTQFIRETPHSKRVLIVGGGTGKILKMFLEKTDESHLVYAEYSQKMLERAKARLLPAEKKRVDFVRHSSDATGSFDCIVLPFILDCYMEPTLTGMLHDLKKQLNNSGQIVFFDFNLDPDQGYQPSVWKPRFIDLLYLFFRITAGIEAKKLPDFHTVFTQSGFDVTKKSLLHKGWIQAILWSKSERMTTSA